MGWWEELLESGRIFKEGLERATDVSTYPEAVRQAWTGDISTPIPHVPFESRIPKGLQTWATLPLEEQATSFGPMAGRILSPGARVPWNQKTRENILETLRGPTHKMSGADALSELFNLSKKVNTSKRVWHNLTVPDTTGWPQNYQIYVKERR